MFVKSGPGQEPDHLPLTVRKLCAAAVLPSPPSGRTCLRRRADARHRCRELKLAAELGLHTSLHVEASGTVADLHEHGLLRDTATFVHANGISDEELRMLADADASLSISLDVELKMGFGSPVTGRALAAGLRPLLSIGDIPSVGGDMFSTMRTAFAVQRGLDGGLHTDDLTVFPVTDPVGTIVSGDHPGLVDTVLVVGRVVKRDGVLLGVDLPALRTRRTITLLEQQMSIWGRRWRSARPNRKLRGMPASRRSGP